MTETGYGIHVFVCENERAEDHPRGCCAARDGKLVRLWFKEAMSRHEILADNRVNRAGCLDYCEAGPAVVIYSKETPGGIWYSPKTRADVDEIVVEHLKNGRAVERLKI